MRIAVLGGLLAAPLLIGTVHAQCKIEDKICALKENFDPAPSSGNNPDNKSPECDPDQTVSVDEIKDAFSVAPTGVKRSLCGLKQIFINSSGRNWGRWNDPSRHKHDNPGAAYVAVDQTELNKSFSRKQDDNLGYLNATVAASVSHSETSDPHKYGLLYVLAHELAHVIWHQQYPPTGTRPGIPCFDQAFGPTWNNSGKVAKGRRWTSFGDEAFGTHKNTNVKKAKLANIVDMYAIYQNGFATALAAANPEEDFVETYALRAISTASCNNCKFFVNFQSFSSIQLNGDRPTLNSKLSCVDGMVSLTSTRVPRSRPQNPY